MTKNEAIQAWRDMFGGKLSTKIQGIHYPMRRIGHGYTLRSFQITTKTGNITLIEQNPSKSSRPAERARNGAKIMWVIPKSGDWFRVEGGNIYRSNETRPFKN